LDLAKLQSTLKILFVPPVLQKRCDDVGLTPKQAVMQAFFKAKMYNDINKKSIDMDDPQLLELDFTLKCNTLANSLLRDMETPEGDVDYSKLAPTWDKEFDRILKEDRASRGLGGPGRAGGIKSPEGPGEGAAKPTVVPGKAAKPAAKKK